MKPLRLALFAWVCFPTWSVTAQAQTIPPGRPSTNPRATAKYEEARAALAKREVSSALAALKDAIELDPDYAAAHDAFALTYQNEKGRIYRKELFRIYSPWLVKYPKNPYIPYQIGKYCSPVVVGRAIDGTEFDWNGTARKVADDYYRKALALDPRFKLAWLELADNAFLLKNTDKQREYLKKAMEIDPSDAYAELNYVASFQQSDAAQFRKLVEEFIQHHPKDDSGIARLLSSMADVARDPTARIAILERIYTQLVGTLGAGAHEYYYFPASMQALFEMYAKQDPEKALEFARDMQKAYPGSLVVSAQTIVQLDEDQNWERLEPLSMEASNEDRMNKYWTEVVLYQSALVEAETLLKKQQAAEAVGILNKINLSDKIKIAPELERLDTFRLELLKAEAFDVGGETAKAYDYLLTRAASLPPNDILRGALLEYGRKLNKREKDVNEDVWHVRAEAPVMKDFELATYDGKKVKLSDYRGRPVLVNFWFPTCGSCIEEFPYLNELAKNYADQGFSVLTINDVPGEDDEAPARMKDYQFVALRAPGDSVPGGSKDWALVNYGVGGGPWNFLLDAEGRVVFRPRLSSLEAQRVVAAEIEELLGRAQVNNAATAGVERP